MPLAWISLVFVAFTAEESGGAGSKYFSAQMNPEKAVAMFNIEMIGTDSKPCRCTALSGEVGRQVACTLYAQRSSTCREFEASWEHGEHNPSCDAARAAYGLPALTPPGANEPHWPDDGIAPGTRWEDVPMNWTCPECAARKEDFEMVEI